MAGAAPSGSGGAGRAGQFFGGIGIRVHLLSERHAPRLYVHTVRDAVDVVPPGSAVHPAARARRRVCDAGDRADRGGGHRAHRRRRRRRRSRGGVPGGRTGGRGIGRVRRVQHAVGAAGEGPRQGGACSTAVSLAQIAVFGRDELGTVAALFAGSDDPELFGS